MRRIRINGWQRLGIILSVGWIIWSYNHTYDHLDYETTKIAVDEEMSCEHEHARAGENFDDFFKTCDALSPAKMPERMKESHDNRVRAATEALIPVPLAWAGAYLVIFLFRWVRRGWDNSD
jgi:hypothetical protein